MVLMNSGQVLYRMSFKGGLSDVFLMVRLRSWAGGGRSQRSSTVFITFYQGHVLSDYRWDVPFDHLGEAQFVRLPHCGLTLPLPFLTVFMVCVPYCEDNRGWDGWMTSPTQWAWVWAELWEMVKDREGWRAAVHGGAESRTWLSDGTANNCVLWKGATVYSPRLRTGKVNSPSERGQHRHPCRSWNTRGTWFKGRWLESHLEAYWTQTRKSACPFKNVWLWVQCKDK